MSTTSLPPREFLLRQGEIIAEFGELTQDSGNISYAVRLPDDTKLFVKTAGHAGDNRWYLPHEQRMALVRNAVKIAGAIGTHPAVPALLAVIESPEGPLLVYEWRAGESLHATCELRERPEAAYQRFRCLPINTLIAALTAVFEVHAVLGRQQYVAVDFYDGSLLYDFAMDRLTLCDLDHYHLGPFTNTMGRMFGSSRYMAPEELKIGAVIDQRTTVFTMGRLLATTLGDGTLARATFRGDDALFSLMCRACAPDPADRFETIEVLGTAWCNASVR
ncbi:MAG: hypothetical protein JWM57_1299 [Phycisphaerales bacterium]|nr:hypothetical protein [Phycisphaerales bacterium]